MEAYSFWEEVRTLRPDWNEAGTKLALALLEEGRKAISENRVDLGLNLLTKAVAISPELAEARVALSNTLIELGRFDEALECWRNAFAFKAEWPEVHYPVQNHFYHYGQRDASGEIQDCTVRKLDQISKEYELDQLGMRILREYPTAIGHLGLLDTYAKAKILGLTSENNPVLLVHPSVANRAYLEYWEELFPAMISDPFAIELLRPLIPYLEDRIAPMMGNDGTIKGEEDYVGAKRQAVTQHAWDKTGRGPLLKLKVAHAEEGWEFLQSYGMPRDAWFVGIHVREAGGNLRAGRNATIDNYMSTIEAVVERGGWVVRSGDPGMTPLPAMSQVIDYAHCPERVDRLDVFLWASAKFFICTPSGPAWIPPTFGVPCVATNWNAYLTWRWYRDDLFIPKLVFSERENRYLTFSEILDSPLGTAEAPAYFASQGARLVENSVDELREVVCEMLDTHFGRISYSESDELLQAKANELWAQRDLPTGARMGAAFLRRWSSLVE